MVDRASWDEPRIFTEIRARGDVDDDEMARVFNLGIGMILVVAEDGVTEALDALEAASCRATVVGTVTPGAGQVRMRRDPLAAL